MNAQEVLSQLERWHEKPCNRTSRAWIFASEVRVGTGWGPTSGTDPSIRIANAQRIDAFAFNVWASHKFERRAYEIKVSRSDLMYELGNLWKSAAALALSNRFFLVIPKVLTNYVKQMDLDEQIPSEWGIITVEDSRLQTLKRAPWRETPDPPHSFMLSMCRNLQASS